ncbi:MAG: hypothetical protein ACJ790_16930 [Myxococcaceae bacterium]
MKALKIAAFAAVVAGLVGCGNSQARLYQLAIDASALGNLPPSCYANNTVPTNKTELTNYKGEDQWAIWDGPDGKQYLDMGTTSFTLGNADPVVVTGVIESTDPKVFSGTRTDRTLPNPSAANPNFSDTQVGTVTVTFDDLGNTTKGTIQLKSEYTCTSCQNNGGKVNCSAQLAFTGRRIDYSNLNPVNANP